MLGLLDKDFKAAIVTRLNEIKENRATTREKRGTLSRAREKMKKEPNGNLQLEKKDHYLKWNNSVDGLRIKRTEEKVCRLEDRPVEIVQAEEEREKWLKEKNQ